MNLGTIGDLRSDRAGRGIEKGSTAGGETA